MYGDQSRVTKTLYDQDEEGMGTEPEFPAWHYLVFVAVMLLLCGGVVLAAVN